MAAAPRLPESEPGTSTRAQSVKQIDLYTPAAVNGGYSWFSTGDPSGSGEPNLGWSHLAVVDPSYPSSSSASLTSSPALSRASLAMAFFPALWGPVGNLRGFAIKAYFEELLSKA